MDKPNFIELCAGCGGLSSGLIKCGFTPIFLNDNNKDCCLTLKENHKDVKIIHEDMTIIDYTPYINKIDLLSGGCPCQSFSFSGKRKGLDDPRGDLLFKFIEIINLINPKTFLIENVKGLISHNKGETFKLILNKLNENENYKIYHKCLDASKYEVPQKRERLFIIGVNKKIERNFEYPKENVNSKILMDVLFDVPHSQGAKYSKEKIELFKLINQGECWVNLPQDLQMKYLGKSYYSKGGKRGILYRLSLNKPSLTLLCSPSQKQTERCHPLEERPLTIREYARIQTFSDDYKFIGSITSQYKQIGNAIPVELGKKIGEEIMKLFD